MPMLTTTFRNTGAWGPGITMMADNSFVPTICVKYGSAREHNISRSFPSYFLPLCQKVSSWYITDNSFVRTMHLCEIRERKRA